MAILAVPFRAFRLLTGKRPGRLAARLCVLLALCGPAAVIAQEAPALELEGLGHVVLRDPLVFTRLAERIDLEELLHLAPAFAVLGDRDVNQGVTDDSFWLHLRLRNGGGEEKRWVLHHETTYLDEMAVWLADEGQPFESFTLSDSLPFDTRPLPYRKLGFEHATPAGSYTDVYLRLGYRSGMADAMSLDLHLWDARAWAEQVPGELLLLGLYYGYLACLLVFSLILMTVLRHRAYLSYGLLVLSTGLLWLHLNGIGFQYLWPAQPAWHNQGFHISFLLFALCALQFSRVFLNTATLLPRMDVLLKGLLGLALAGLLLRLAGFYTPVLYVAAFCLASLMLLPLLGWLCWRQGERHALWFTIAWSFYGFSVLIAVLSAYTSFLHWGMEPLLFTQLGTLVENVLLLFATAQRVMSLERERSAAMHLAYTDPLTLLGNRRLLSQSYHQRLATFKPGDPPLFLLLIDLDHFKSINDAFGHAAGDRVLVDAAQLMVASTRADDLCVRYGGEEFALFVQVADQEAALDLAERLRAQFAGGHSLYRGETIAHTLSIGMTLACEGFSKLDEKEALRRADAALYQAKEQGRNRVVLYSPILDAGGRICPSPPPHNQKIQEDS